LNIVFCIEGFFPGSKGGTETYVLNLSKELIKLGFQVSVVVPAVGKESNQYKYEKIPVYSFSVPKKVTTKELNGLELPTGIEEFKNIIEKINPDILHMHSLGRSIHGEHLKLASGLGIKTVFTAHLASTFCVKGNLRLFGNDHCNGFVEKQRCLACFIKEKQKIDKTGSNIAAWFINNFITKSPLINKMPTLNIVSNKINQLNLLRKYSRQNIALAGWLKEIYLINGLKDTVTINQGIDESFTQIKSIDIKQKGRINLIFVGRMHPLKNLDLLLSVLKNLANQINFIVITIPFDDEIDYYNSVKDQFYQCGFKDWFENLTSEQVAEKLEESDVLILPSKYEAAPLVILEAFAKKIPVIGSDYIAIKEMVSHNVNGLLFKNGDANSLKEQLQRLVDEPGLLQSFKQNIGLVRTFKEVAKEHQQLYETQLAGNEKTLEE
jgi:glycosyltransferase involved in cell wall biosynthesis